MSNARTMFKRRTMRTRSRVKRLASDRPRLSVFRSGKHIYAQVIDDKTGNTLAAASSLDKDLKGSLKTGADTSAAAEVGKLVAKRAAEKGVGEVVFDRGGYKYHGRVKALADGAREGGLSF
ncbi:MAG: 50S ribosomal protein L18 [Rhodospirillales bacterium]|nr:50S ribosomal protein L18 [Rhodospirillales bacterium]MBO6786414.1 50S ribosomal protein L18 [Rhodospirillales bacterium]